MHATFDLNFIVEDEGLLKVRQSHALEKWEYFRNSDGIEM